MQNVLPTTRMSNKISYLALEWVTKSLMYRSNERYIPGGLRSSTLPLSHRGSPRTRLTKNGIHSSTTSSNTDLTLGQRRRRWPNIKKALCQLLVPPGNARTFLPWNVPLSDFKDTRHDATTLGTSYDLELTYSYKPLVVSRVDCGFVI